MRKVEENSSKDTYSEISKKLDILIALLLTKEGFRQGEIAKILHLRKSSIQKMFVNKWNTIKRGELN